MSRDSDDFKGRNPTGQTPVGAALQTQYHHVDDRGFIPHPTPSGLNAGPPSHDPYGSAPVRPAVAHLFPASICRNVDFDRVAAVEGRFAASQRTQEKYAKMARFLRDRKFTRKDTPLTFMVSLRASASVPFSTKDLEDFLVYYFFSKRYASTIESKLPSGVLSGQIPANKKAPKKFELTSIFAAVTKEPEIWKKKVTNGGGDSYIVDAEANLKRIAQILRDKLITERQAKVKGNFKPTTDKTEVDKGELSAVEARVNEEYADPVTGQLSDWNEEVRRLYLTAILNAVYKPGKWIFTTTISSRFTEAQRSDLDKAFSELTPSQRSAPVQQDEVGSNPMLFRFHCAYSNIQRTYRSIRDGKKAYKLALANHPWKDVFAVRFNG